MAVKRRVIWMTDEEWSILTEYAKGRGETVSSAIRRFWLQASSAEHHKRWEAGLKDLTPVGTSEPIVAEGSLGAIAAAQRAVKPRLRQIVHSDTFGAPQAAPKPGGKKR